MASPLRTNSVSEDMLEQNQPGAQLHHRMVECLILAGLAEGPQPDAFGCEF